jgi:uncharacterized membrane protein YobD (UPF0266 family)
VKKDLFTQAPGWLGRKVVGIPLVSIIGLITAIGFGYVGFIAYSNAAITTVNLASVELLVAMIVMGFVIFYLSKWYHKREGLDTSMALKEIPPE